MQALDQADGLRRMFGASAQRVALLDCLITPLTFDPASLGAPLFKLELADALTVRDARCVALLFEASEPGVLDAYARLKALAVRNRIECPVYAWSHSSAGEHHRFGANLVEAAQRFLRLRIAYRGAIATARPDAPQRLAEQIAELLGENVAKTQQGDHATF